MSTQPQNYPNGFVGDVRTRGTRPYSIDNEKHVAMFQRIAIPYNAIGDPVHLRHKRIGVDSR